MELPYCVLHAAQKPRTDRGWAEQEMAPLPNIQISLKSLSSRTHKLLSTHSGCLPLPRYVFHSEILKSGLAHSIQRLYFHSFPSCYEIEFGESIQVDENGVPLEHLLSCLATVELKQGLGTVKHIVWAVNKNQDESHEGSDNFFTSIETPPLFNDRIFVPTEQNNCANSPLANQLALFSRESVDLLKTAPHCQLPFNRFIPAYHHHFGRQCRVADYGFTKLIELLEALTHSVQVGWAL